MEFMKWKGRRSSTNVEDRRSSSSSGRSSGGSGQGLAIISLIGSKFGIKGILVAVIGFVLLWKLGIVNPSMLVDSGATGGPSSPPAQITAEEQELYEFVRVVLADTEDLWAQEFAERGKRYVAPTLVVYRGQTRTACGPGQASMGPFYCPADQKVYIDLSFYDELDKTFQAPGDFAQAYVIAHEVGHHVQNLLGISEMVHKKRGQPDFNEWSVRLELQADYLAGIWAKYSRQYMESGDMEEALTAANAIGDDAIQLRARGRVVPHAFTHGTSEQRMRWFNLGFQSGDLEDGNTFSPDYSEL